VLFSGVSGGVRVFSLFSGAVVSIFPAPLDHWDDRSQPQERSMPDPFFCLYLSLWFTSATAALAAREVGHSMLARVYVANSMIYGLLGVFHLLGL
jgi:hypothetical protein